ncbi:hypothetical protein CY0110_18122 [Crocosphaera chwakensis CCY0110]|uniref:Uncharacterized protein n=1 Tax=Crocosphaera chwakensis CCY0110 TaxID=391612 RepID=A3IIV6_9CHRO|nr:hypothetical protein CY0110_18122 [Crocosphaera chwakensis CCY0110]
MYRRPLGIKRIAAATPCSKSP